MSDDPKDVARELADSINPLTPEQAEEISDKETEAIEENAKKTGCPLCDWSGEIAETHDRTHRYYTHVIVKSNGEMFKGKTCSERTKPKKRGLLSRLFK